MTRARVDYKGGEYVEVELIRFDSANTDGPGIPPGNTWVLREEDGSVIALEAESGRAEVEIQCDYCGTWSTHAASSPTGGWRCYGGTGQCKV